MTTLIVGGSSGLGLALAKEFAGRADKVIVTGRGDPKADFADFKELDLAGDNLPELIRNFVADLPEVDVLVYAAGLYPFGTVTDLSPKQIDASINVAGRGLIFFARELLAKQGKLAQLITISSTAWWRPMKKEVIYDFVKAGIGQFSNGLAKDERVGKVLVAAPATLKNDDEAGDGLKRSWVAEQILKAQAGDYDYKFIKILRQPDRVEVADER